MAVTDKFSYVGEPGSATYLASPGYTMGGSSINLQTYVGWPTGKVIFDMYTTELVGQTEQAKAGTRTSWQGIHNGSGVISSLQRLGGNDQNYPAASSSKVVITHSAYHTNQMVDGIANQHNLTDGSHKGITTDTLTASGAVTAASFIVAGSQTAAGWLPVGATISGNPTYNGNRSYDLTFSADMSNILSPGMRLQTQNTVAQPTQCTQLNGTNQHWIKTSPAGMTFTDDFVAGAWVKLSSYAIGTILSRYNGTSGWNLRVDPSGQVVLLGYKASGANYSYVLSSQSLPLNKWVHITAQLDMSAFTATSTTSYIMIDGVDVPVSVGRGGTNPTDLTQAGNLEVGSTSGGANPFPGKIAQAFVSSAKITQANVRTLMSQGLTPALISANNIVSAFSFDGNANDLNTTNANNLTAANGAVATNADSFTGVQGNGNVSATLNCALVIKVNGATVTVQTPEGCTIPTSGGISSLSYATSGVPFGWVSSRARFRVSSLYFVRTSLAENSTSTWYNQGHQLSVPIGAWACGYNCYLQVTHAGSVGLTASTGIGETSSSAIPESVSMLPALSTSVQEQDGPAFRTIDKVFSAQTVCYLNTKPAVATTTVYVGHGLNATPVEIFAEPAEV